MPPVYVGPPPARKMTSPDPAAAVAAASVANGAVEVPFPPPLAELSTYQTRPLEKSIVALACELCPSVEFTS